MKFIRLKIGSYFFRVIQLSTDAFISTSEAAEFYLQKLENVGAKRTHNFQLDLATYSIPTIENVNRMETTAQSGISAKNMHVLSHAEYPSTVFSFIEQSQCGMLLADCTFVDLLQKLSFLGIFPNRPIKTEAKGSRLEFQDFFINLSTVHQSQTTKGIILEVDFNSIVA